MIDFIYKYYPKCSLRTIKIHYHEHTSLPLLVHILNQTNSVQVTSEHSNNIWWKHKLSSSLIRNSPWNKIWQKIYNIHHVTCNKTDTVHCEASKNISKIFTMRCLIIYPDISPWDVQQNIKNTKLQMHDKTTR